jgi:hypothetical protein
MMNSCDPVGIIWLGLREVVLVHNLDRQQRTAD